MTIQYKGEKHCELVHGPSDSQIETDAPKDNQGKGEKFSPTDLVGAALGSCILTTLEIVLEREGHRVDLRGAHAQVVKTMTGAPRRIESLQVQIFLPDKLTSEQRKRAEEIAHTCPVHRSLHPDVQIPMEFQYIQLS